MRRPPSLARRAWNVFMLGTVALLAFVFVFAVMYGFASLLLAGLAVFGIQLSYLQLCGVWFLASIVVGLIRRAFVK